MINLLAITPPASNPCAEEGALNTILAIVIIILIFVVIILSAVARHYATKSKAQHTPAYLTSEEIAYIKAYRQTQGKNTNKEISFETLDEDELRLLQEYRKNLKDNITQK